MRYSYLFSFLFLISVACDRSGEQADAFGNFESEDVIVSAETQGRILSFPHAEGERIEIGQILLLIDTTQIHLKRLQLLSGKRTLASRMNTLEAQIRVTEVQQENAKREAERLVNLVEGGAATEKQLDDMRGNLRLIDASLEAQRSQLATLTGEGRTLDIQIAQVNDQISKCSVRSPLKGTLLSTYKKEGELVVPGQVLCKIANMDELILRAYVSGNQLAGIRTGETVKVRVDGTEGTNSLNGVVRWVSPQAEFTPKIIQTREERVDLVYAIKVMVRNDGSLKIGMPGEVILP